VIICAGCGERNADGLVFCVRCGVFLEWEGEKVSDPNAASPGVGAGVGTDAGVDAASGVDAFQAGSPGGSGRSDDAVSVAGADVASSQVTRSQGVGPQATGARARTEGGDRVPLHPSSANPGSANSSANPNVSPDRPGAFEQSGSGSLGPRGTATTVTEATGAGRVAGILRRLGGGLRRGPSSQPGIAPQPGGSATSGTAVQPDTAQPHAAQPGAAQPVTPRQPQRARRRRPPTRGPAQNIPTGSLICGACAMPNQSDRKFCARCGHSLAAAKVVRKAPWWRRLLGRERVYEVGTRRAPGQAGRRLGAFVRVGVVVLVLAAIGILAGPQRGLVISAYHGVQNLLLHPEQVRPSGQQANAAAKVHPASHAFDGSKGTFWAPARTSVKGGAIPWLRATFAEPVSLVTIGITPGMSVDTPKFVAGTRPAQIEVSVATDGDPVVKRFHVADTAGFQKFDIDAPGARSVQIAVLSSTGTHPTLATAITEVEFWAKR
jgi:hypothetical protein